MRYDLRWCFLEPCVSYNTMKVTTEIRKHSCWIIVKISHDKQERIPINVMNVTGLVHSGGYRGSSRGCMYTVERGLIHGISFKKHLQRRSIFKYVQTKCRICYIFYSNFWPLPSLNTQEKMSCPGSSKMVILHVSNSWTGWNNCTGQNLFKMSTGWNNSRVEILES